MEAQARVITPGPANCLGVASQRAQRHLLDFGCFQLQTDCAFSYCVSAPDPSSQRGVSVVCQKDVQKRTFLLATDRKCASRHTNLIRLCAQIRDLVVFDAQLDVNVNICSDAFFSDGI